MKKRNIFLALLFSLLTVGIYNLYWFVKLTNDSNTLAPKNATASGGTALLLSLITFGIYRMYWCYKLGQKTGEMLGEPSKGALYLFLAIITLGIVPMCLSQSAINKVSENESTAAKQEQVTSAEA